MQGKPLVSVLMTAYNREKYISEAIESVLASTYTNFELIIVDDCSTDNTVAIARTFEEKDKRIKVYVNENNLGDYPNRNKAASYSNGKYIKYLDSDDCIYRHSLEIMVEYMEEHKDVALAFCDNAIQDDVSVYPVKYFPKESYQIHFLEGGLFYAGPGGIILSKEKFNIAGGFTETRFLSDMELVMKLALNYPIIKIQAGLIWWRIHENQEVAFERKHHNVLAVRYKTSVEYLNKSNLSVREKKVALYILKKLLIRNILRIAFKHWKLNEALKVYKYVKLKPGDLFIAFDISTWLKRKFKIKYESLYKPSDVLKKSKSVFKKRFNYVLNRIPSNNFFNAFLKSKSNKGIIIAFHRILSAQDQYSEFNSFIEISTFKLEEIIINLKKLHVRFVPLKELNDSLNISASFGYPIVHISFDDGYYDNYSAAFEILKKHNVCFSIFITSDFIDNELPFVWWYMVEYIIKNEIPVCFEKYDFAITENTYKTNVKIKIFESFRNFILDHIDNDRNYFEEKLLNYLPITHKNILPKMLGWKQINEMVSSGLCELGVHTKSHARFANLIALEKIEQIEYCKKEILVHTGINARYFAYPFGSKTDIGNTKDLEEIMETCGIELAFTTIPGELNNLSSKLLMPRIFLNARASMYTLKTRVNGSYQRDLK